MTLKANVDTPVSRQIQIRGDSFLVFACCVSRHTHPITSLALILWKVSQVEC